MTHRERIISALQHKEPDRVPVDLGATESSGIMGIAYNRLKKYLGIAGKTQIYDMMQMIAKVEMPVVEAVGSDAIPLLIEPKQWKNWILQDGSIAEIPAKLNTQKKSTGEIVQLADDGTEVARCPVGGIYFDPVFFPLANAKTLEDVDNGQKYFESFDWPSYIDEDFKDLRVKAQKLHKETDYAIVGNLWVHILASGMSLRGYENFMMDMVLNKPFAHRILEKQLEAYLPRVEKYIEAVGDYVQVIQVNDDLGSQNGPLLSPELYREIVKPYHKKLWGFIKEKSGKPILLHSCGSIYKLIPDLIEIGVDALNPVQVSAADMDTARLKKEFGRDITFWGGGCDTQNVLGTGTPEQVRDEVRRRVNDLASGGGFVFCQVHNIQANVPPENIMAMYTELSEISRK
ncbi:MAG: uroporphyrinogen decarboxylase family protein [Phycisphaerae bacterium]|jgi:uroporphyrinogen decarboxylase